MDEETRALVEAEAPYLEFSSERNKILCILNNHEIPPKKEPLQAFIKCVYMIMHEFGKGMPSRFFTGVYEMTFVLGVVGKNT